MFVFADGKLCSYAGIATHYLDSSSLPDLEARLGELNFKDYATLQDRLRIINDTVEEFATGIPHDQPMQIAGQIRQAIDYVFQPSTGINDIMDALREAQEKAPGPVKEWAKKTEDTIKIRSPTSVKVALRQIRDGKKWDISQTFRHEHHIASKFMEHPDFVEGVSVKLIHKSKEQPKWNPATFDEVSDEEVASFIGTNPTDLELLNTGEGTDYKDYPHSWIGLPREIEVEAKVREGEIKDVEGVIQYFLHIKRHKMGVREKVQEILDRMTYDKGGVLQWSLDGEGEE